MIFFDISAKNKKIYANFHNLYSFENNNYYDFLVFWNLIIDSVILLCAT
jgi:hypothetical protein